jgi:hypothetical protein
MTETGKRTDFHYGVLESDDAGGSRMIEVRLDQQEAVIAAGVPPVQVSVPIPATAVIFVDVPEGVVDSEPHQAPRRQFVVVLEGVLECETTDGEVRRFGPGGVAMAADVDGAGHITRVVEHPARFLMIPLAD